MKATNTHALQSINEQTAVVGNNTPSAPAQSRTLLYAGIGSRETPEPVLKTLTKLAARLAELGFTLRTGAAVGADLAFYKGATVDHSILYLPWDGYNGFHASENPRFNTWIPEEAFKLAEKHHPAWSKCTLGAQKLHARNCQIVLGRKLNRPVDFVLCWHQNSGGTMQAVRIAEAFNIPVINLADPWWKERLTAIVKLTKKKEQLSESPLPTKGRDLTELAKIFYPVKAYHNMLWDRLERPNTDEDYSAIENQIRAKIAKHFGISQSDIEDILVADPFDNLPAKERPWVKYRGALIAYNQHNYDKLIKKEVK